MQLLCKTHSVYTQAEYEKLCTQSNKYGQENC